MHHHHSCSSHNQIAPHLQTQGLVQQAGAPSGVAAAVAALLRLGQALTAAEAAPAWGVPDVCLHTAGSAVDQRLPVGLLRHRQRQGGVCAQECRDKRSALAEAGFSSC